MRSGSYKVMPAQPTPRYLPGVHRSSTRQTITMVVSQVGGHTPERLLPVSTSSYCSPTRPTAAMNISITPGVLSKTHSATSKNYCSCHTRLRTTIITPRACGTPLRVIAHRFVVCTSSPTDRRPLQMPPLYSSAVATHSGSWCCPSRWMTMRRHPV